MQKRLGRLAVEFVVVVLGVLVALAADAAMDGFQERELERSALERLRADLAADLALLDSTHIPVVQGQRAGQGEFRSWLQGGRVPSVSLGYLNSEQLPSDSVAVVVGLVGALSYFTFDARTAAIEDLQSTGTLRLIRDQSLREDILQYYNEIKNTAEIDVVHRATAVQLLTQAGPGVLGFALPLGLEGFNRGELSEDLRAAAAMATDDRLRAEGKLEEMLASIGYLQVLQRTRYLALRVGCAELIESIDAELERSAGERAIYQGIAAVRI